MDHVFQFAGGSGLPTYEVVEAAPPSERPIGLRLPGDSGIYDGNYGTGSIKSLMHRSPQPIPFEFRQIDNAPDAIKKSYGGGYGLSAGYGLWAGALLAGLRANAPGAWSADRLKQANHFLGIAYTAISALCDGVSSAILEVTDLDPDDPPSSIQKSISHTTRKGVAVPYDHEVCQLFENPNPNDTFKDLLYKTVLQLSLTGNCLMWMVPNRLALPSELYVIPTALAYPVPYSQAWPRGAWRLTPLYPYGPFAVLPTPVATAGAVVPADDILHLKLPHPLLTWDGYSPLTAGARQIDIMEMMDDARWAAMDGGINPSMVFTVDPEKSGVNFNQDALDSFTARLTQKYASTRNFGKAMVLPPGVDGKGYSTVPADMAFDGGWEQMRDFILSLWGVPKGVVGITEASSYAALYASLKQFYLIKLIPTARFIADHWTKKLAVKFRPSLRISLPIPALDDPHLLEEQLKTDLQAGVRMKGEWRVMRGLLPFGDERDNEIVGVQEAVTPESDNASKTNPKNKPGSAPVNERRDEADNARPNNTSGLHSLPGMDGAKSLPTGPPRLHKYASTQFNLPDDVATRIKAIGLRIRDDELAGSGLELLSHITIKYGLICDDENEIIECVRGFGPVIVRLGLVTVFEADPEITSSVVSPGTPVVVQPQRGHAEFDVLKVDVHSDRLVALNRLLSENFPHHDSYPIYSPHCTIAYLSPGIGKNFLGSRELEGTEITFNHFLFSDRDGHTTIVPLQASRLTKALRPSTNGHAKAVMAGITSDLIPPPATKPKTKLLRNPDDILPPPAPSRPRRSLPFTGKKTAPRRIGDLTTVYPPPNPKPYPDATLSPMPGPSAPIPEYNAVAVNSIYWHVPEMEWNLFRHWANALPNWYPSLHNLAENGWARGPRTVATELLSATNQTSVDASPELKMAILALISICENAQKGEVSVFVKPEIGPNPGPPLMTDMKSLTPSSLKGDWKEDKHPRADDGKFGSGTGSSDSENESDSPLPDDVPSSPENDESTEDDTEETEEPEEEIDEDIEDEESEEEEAGPSEEELAAYGTAVQQWEQRQANRTAARETIENNRRQHLPNATDEESAADLEDSHTALVDTHSYTGASVEAAKANLEKIAQDVSSRLARIDETHAYDPAVKERFRKELEHRQQEAQKEYDNAVNFAEQSKLVKTPDEIVERFAQRFRDDQARAVEALQILEVTAKELGEFPANQKKFENSVAKFKKDYSAKLEKLKTSTQKWHETKAEFDKIADGEPELAYPDLLGSLPAPKKPEYDPSVADESAFEAAEEQYEKDYDEWSNRKDEIDSLNEKSTERAEEVHEKEHAKWEKSYDKAEKFLAKAEEAIGDQQESLNEVHEKWSEDITEWHDIIRDSYGEALGNVEMRIDDAEVSDDEPEEPGSSPYIPPRTKSIRRMPPAIFSAGGIVPPPPDLAAALAGLNTTMSSLPTQLASIIASQKKQKRIEVETNPDGTHRAYKIEDI